jgi:transposase-like protein
MTRYSDERKAAILKNLLPPLNKTVAEVSRLERVSDKTLYHWRTQAKQLGLPVPGKTPTTESWSSDAKLAVIIETAVLTESELSQYCREKGLYKEQINRWKEDCLAGFQRSKEQGNLAIKQAKKDKHQIKSLKKELRRKEKALAETAALLVLRKKFDALLGLDDEES